MSITAVRAGDVDAFPILQQSVALLSDAVATRQFADPSSTVKRIRSLTNSLENAFEDAKQPIPTIYASALRQDAQLLKQAINTGDDSLRAEILSAVLSDLQIKNDYLNRRALGAVNWFNPLVSVSINTLRAGHRVNGYLVRCNWRRSVDEAHPSILFNEPTSPTRYKLPPAIYPCFLEKDGSIALRQDIEVGMLGELEQTIDVSVP
jgi:hypothetical protein